MFYNDFRQDEAERLRANPLLYLLNPNIKVRILVLKLIVYEIREGNISNVTFMCYKIIAWKI